MKSAQLAKSKPLAETIRLLTLDGHARGDILNALATEHGTQNLTKAFKETGKHFEQIASEPTMAVYGWAIESTRRIYNKMVETGDLNGALKAAKQVSDLREKANSSQQAFLDI